MSLKPIRAEALWHNLSLFSVVAYFNKFFDKQNWARNCW